MIRSKIIITVLFLLYLCSLPTLALAKGKRHFTLENSQYGTRLVKWEGKDSVVDFNNIQELKDVKVIGEMAFEMNKYIKQVILPDNLREISDFAFARCINLKGINLPASLQKIGYRAFGNCESLLFVKYNSNPKVDSSAFMNCPISQEK